MAVLRMIFARRDVGRTERGFRALQLVSSAAVSLGHGGNDAQKTMGVITALLVATGHAAAHGGKLHVPLWTVLACEAMIALGTFSGGWRIVRTMGFTITELRPVSGFAAETSAAIALFGSTALGAPVSTTHTVAGAVSGVGITNRGTTTNWSVFGRVALAWLFTMPFTAVVAAAAYELTPLKDACLGKCRSPLGLLLGSWRDGWFGALRMGAKNGAWCVGCCWALMASFFALGIMSVVWMGIVAGLIAIEKTLPWRRVATWGVTALLLALGLLLLAVPDAVPGLTIPSSGEMSQMSP
jgi:predicted metal-binding membrane protein